MKCNRCGKKAIYVRCGKFYYCKECALGPQNECAVCGKKLDVVVDVAWDEPYRVYCSQECYAKCYGYERIENTRRAAEAPEDDLHGLAKYEAQ